MDETVEKPRCYIKPGTRIKHNGMPYTAATNVANGLYAFSAYEKIRITDFSVQVILNKNGTPLIV